MKTKLNFKTLIAMLIVLVAILAFNSTIVQATEITQEEILNLIPDTIYLDVLETEIIPLREEENGNVYTVADDLIKEQMDKILKDENITNYHSRATRDVLVGFYEATITIENENNQTIAQKKINIKCKNTDKYNTIDEQYVKNKYASIEKELIDSLNIIYEEYDFEELCKIIKESSSVIVNSEFVANQINNLLNDSSIKCYFEARAGDWGCIVNDTSGALIITKNDVVYVVEDVSYFIKPVIIIPNEIEDTEEAYMKYTSEMLINHMKVEHNANEEINLKKGNNPNEYLTSYSGYGKIYPIIIRKNKPETKVEVDEETNVKLDAPVDVVPADTVMEVEPIEEGEKFEEIKEILEKVEVKKFKVFDITLTSKGVKIQPNGKVKISIPIPNDFNSGKLVVYRIEENGKRIGYAVEVYEENNLKYARFETDHFSNYVLAEGELVEENESGEIKGELDNTPKTGTVDISFYILPITIISAIGILALKKKNTK